MKLVTTTSDLYGFFSHAKDQVAFFEGTGFRYLDFSFYDILAGEAPLMGDAWEQEIREAKETANRLGFSFVQAHAPSYNPLKNHISPTLGMEAMIRSIRACKILGIRNMVTHMGFCPLFPYPSGEQENFKANADFFRLLIPELEHAQLTLCMENSCEQNMAGQYFCMTARELSDFVEYLNHPLFAAAWDVGHAHIQKENTCDAMIRLGKKLRAIHVHDNNGKSDQHLPPYTGSFDFELLKDGMLRSGFDGFFTLEADRFLGFSPSVTLAQKKASLIYLYETGKAMLTRWNLWEE
jgi:sugar phosphate isomerase/epimerase